MRQAHLLRGLSLPNFRIPIIPLRKPRPYLLYRRSNHTTPVFGAPLAYPDLLLFPPIHQPPPERVKDPLHRDTPIRAEGTLPYPELSRMRNGSKGLLWRIPLLTREPRINLPLSQRTGRNLKV